MGRSQEETFHIRIYIDGDNHMKDVQHHQLSRKCLLKLVRYHNTPIRLAKIITVTTEMWRNWIIYPLLVGMCNDINTPEENSLGVFKKAIHVNIIQFNNCTL